MKKEKIVLFALPPVYPNMPLAGISILKSFLESNSYNVEIIYLNKLFQDTFKINDYDITNSNSQLLLFCYYLAKKNNDKLVLQRIYTYVFSYYSNITNYDENSISEFFENMISEIHSVIVPIMDRLNNENPILLGFPGIFFQWIPAVLIFDIAKTINPDFKIVIGGLEDEENYELLTLFSNFDFAISGNAEYSLLQLCNKIINHKTDFSDVPSLAFRDGNKIILNTEKNKKYIDFSNYIFPNYDDYFKTLKTEKELADAIIPLNTIRNCRWGKCKFCCYANAFNYQERSPENIIEQIKTIFDKYNITKFYFVDHDIVGKDINRFIKLLDLLIHLQNESEYDFNFSAEIIHKNLSPEIYKKFSLAGFSLIHFGMEATNDQILKKTHKITSFADNIHAIKFCIKYNINLGLSIIPGIPDEIEEDIHQSISNLKYLRFYISNNKLKFSKAIFTLYKKAPYYLELSKEELNLYNTDHISRFFSYNKQNISKPLELFAVVRDKLKYQDEWDSFFKIVDFYYDNKFYYSILFENEKYFYNEYFNSEKIESIIFDEINWDILCAGNEKLISFNDLSIKIFEKHPNITIYELKEFVLKLKLKYLLYTNDNLNEIITIIDTSALS